MTLCNWEMRLIIFIRGRKKLVPRTGYTEVPKALLQSSER